MPVWLSGMSLPSICSPFRFSLIAAAVVFCSSRLAGRILTHISALDGLLHLQEVWFPSALCRSWHSSDLPLCRLAAASWHCSMGQAGAYIPVSAMFVDVCATVCLVRISSCRAKSPQQNIGARKWLQRAVAGCSVAVVRMCFSSMCSAVQWTAIFQQQSVLFDRISHTWATLPPCHWCRSPAAERRKSTTQPKMSADYVAQLVPGATVQSSSEWDEYGEQQCVEIALGPSGDLRLFLFSAGQDKPALTVRQLTARVRGAGA